MARLAPLCLSALALLLTGCTIIIQAPIVCPEGTTLREGRCMGTVVGVDQEDEPAGQDEAPNSPEAQRVRDIQAKVGTSRWDDAVKAILTGTYDKNNSDTLDTPSEIDAVPCSVWATLDAVIKDAEGKEITLMSLYGFPRGYLYNAESLGISESVRDHANEKLRSCGLAI